MELDPSLTRKLLFSNKSNRTNNNSTTSAANQRIAQDALQAAGELIRQFIIETRHRASIEAEFENEMRNSSSNNSSSMNRKDDDESNNDNDSDDFIESSASRKRKRGEQTGVHQGNNSEEDEASFIQPKHILKVSAEILMDFS